MAKRKFLSEFALHMPASQILILQQGHLGELTEADFEPNHRCHIYAIARRPRITLDMKTLNITPEKIDGVVFVQRRENQHIFEFSVDNHSERPVERCECDYPYNSEFQFFDAEGECVLDGSVAHFLLKIGIGARTPELFDLEILYVGQSYGADGARMAPQRLGHHETLQKIYADAMRRSPEMDIWLVLFSQ